MPALDLFDLGGWYFLPTIFAGWVQTAFYAIWVRAGEPRPQPGSRLHNLHRKRIQICLVLGYLFYLIYEADYQIRRERDFYQDLGVSYDVDERGLQSKFRRLTVQYHPDKITSSDNRPLVEQFYVHLKLCRDTLLNPAKRFAYERFGPDSLQWRHCTTIKDFIVAGAQRVAGYYAATAVALVVLGITGRLQEAVFWRYFALGVLLMFEIETMTRPHNPWLLTRIINPIITITGSHPPYLPFQLVKLLRSILVSFFIALSQIVPLLFPPQASRDGDGVSGQQLERLAAVAGSIDQETTRLLGLELTPFATEAASMHDLRGAMRTWLVDNTIKSNATVRDAIGRVVERRRAGAPAGARGT